MRGFLIFFVGAVVGIFLHAVFVYKNNFDRRSLAQIQEFLGIPTSQVANDKNSSSITIVRFDGIKFVPKKVDIYPGNTLEILNISQNTQMWLKSTIPELNFTRGYGNSEKISLVLNTEGDYSVRESLSGSELEIVVATN